MIRFMHLQRAPDMAETDRLIGCQRKFRYAGQAHANLAIRNTIRRKQAPQGDDRRLEAYPCEHCNGWHIGHQKKRST